MCKHRGESDIRQADSQGTRWYDRPFFLDSANHVEHMLQDFATVGDGMVEGDKSVGDKAHPTDVEVGSFFPPSHREHSPSQETNSRKAQCK